jgi:hypothetical protein
MRSVFAIADRKNKCIFEINPYIFGADYMTEEERFCWHIFYHDQSVTEDRLRAEKEK